MTTAATVPSTLPSADLGAIESATRREFLVMLGAAGLLAACGGDGADRDVAEGSEGETITVENRFGTFEVPREPQRVVGWEGRRDLETTLALGLTPVGIGDNALFGGDELAPFVDLDLDSVEVIVQVEPNLELIASLRPDLILTRDSDIEELLDELRPLAPLVPVMPDGPWRPDLEAIADALDRRPPTASMPQLALTGWSSSTPAPSSPPAPTPTSSPPVAPTPSCGPTEPPTAASPLTPTYHHQQGDLMTSDLLDRPALYVPDIVDDATRRQFLAGIAAAGLLAGCSSAAPTSPAGPATRSVTNRFGTFEVPLEPRRPIVLEGRRDLETALALGYEPVAVGLAARLEEGEGVADFLGWSPGEVRFLSSFQVNLEEIAVIGPDLILGPDLRIEQVAPELARIAPIVPVSAATAEWRAELESIAVALGREDRISPLLADYDAQVSEVHERHAGRLGTVTVAVLQGGSGDGQFYGATATGSEPYLQAIVLAEIGGRQPPELTALAEPVTGRLTFSAEQLGLLEGADAILLIASTDAERRDVEASVLWPGLPAVRAGRVVTTDYRTNEGSVFAARECLRLIDRLLDTLA